MRHDTHARLAIAANLLALIAGCVTVPSTQLVQDTAYRDRAMDAGAITLVSWNIAKGRARGWRAAQRDAGLRARLSGADLLLLQEACEPAARSGLGEMLRGRGWAFAVSFESASLGCGGDIATGVLTVSRAAPLMAKALRSQHREFGITPKTALATTYAIRGSPGHLLVVNAHMLNFEWLGAGDFAAQLDRIGTLIAAHRGPVILAGDLNTRNGQRLGLVKQLAVQYGLRPVFGEKPNGRTQASFGRGFALDHVFYRGLSVVASGRVGHEAEQDYSDHNSLAVTFAISASGAEAR